MRQLFPVPSPGVDELARTARSRAETLVIAPQEKHGGSDHRVDEADRWVYVLSGEGRAVVDDQPVELRPGVVLLIEAGESHELSNDGDTPLETLNIYA